MIDAQLRALRQLFGRRRDGMVPGWVLGPAHRLSRELIAQRSEDFVQQVDLGSGLSVGYSTRAVVRHDVEGDRDQKAYSLHTIGRTEAQEWPRLQRAAQHYGRRWLGRSTNASWGDVSGKRHLPDEHP